MKASLKRAFIFSSLGGVVLGAAAAVALARRARKPILASLVHERIPPDAKRISLRTERFEIERAGRREFAHDEYFLQSTPFKIWNLLGIPAAGEARTEGIPVYHVTLTRHGEPSRDPEGADSFSRMDKSARPETLERFYGTVWTPDPSWPPNSLARGALLEIRKCSVGGASNAVETGEVHRSSGPLLNYRFEYSSAAKDSDPDGSGSPR